MASKSHYNAKVGFMFIFGAIWLFPVVTFTFLAFLALGLTILSIWAWNESLYITPKTVIEPEEAHAFVGLGVSGMCLVPAFAFFTEVLFGIHINWGPPAQMMAFGYVGGSVGIQFLLAVVNGNDEAPSPYREDVLPPPQDEQALTQTPPEPFKYASWDDEEASHL